MPESGDGAAARACAARAINAVLTRGRNLERAFASAGIEQLPARDGAFARSLAFGTLRTHLRNTALLGQLLDRPLRRRDAVVEALLSVALHELAADAAPGYAVVSAAVDAVSLLRRPALRGLVNAVLRRFQREQATLMIAAQKTEPARYGYPQWIIDAVRGDWEHDWQAVLEAGNQQAPLWLRVNRMRTSRAAYRHRLEAAGISIAYAPDEAPDALCLKEAVPVAELPGFAAGECSVQDPASQLAAVLLDPKPGMRVLDACAAPGGKTGHLLELAGGDLQLTALDSDAKRLQRVSQNLDRLGLEARVMCGDALEPATWWDGKPFDRILLDAPCSATGVIRRHPDIRFLRRAADIPALRAVQQSLLATLWSLLKPGGRLLYSTCSLLRAENDTVIREFLTREPGAKAEDVGSALPVAARRPAREGAYLLPGGAATDGFFYALMARRPD